MPVATEPAIVKVSRGNLIYLLDILRSIVPGAPLYRALNDKNMATYLESGTLMPFEEVDLLFSGVIFYFDLKHVAERKPPIVVVSSLERLSKGRKIVDTRNPGYDREFRKCLDREVGEGRYSCWDLWQRITQHDTIATKSPVTSEYPKGLPIYAARLPVTQDDLFFDVRVEE